MVTFLCLSLKLMRYIIANSSRVIAKNVSSVDENQFDDDRIRLIACSRLGISLCRK